MSDSTGGIRTTIGVFIHRLDQDEQELPLRPIYAEFDTVLAACDFAEQQAATFTRGSDDIARIKIELVYTHAGAESSPLFQHVGAVDKVAVVLAAVRASTS